METGNEVLERLHTLMHRMKRRLHQAAREEGDGLTPMEVRALSYFARHPGHTASNLVEHAGRDKAQVARLVKLLLARDLLNASPAPHDQRSLQLRLTDAGRRIERRMAARRRKVELQLVDGFAESDLRQMRDFLDRMVTAVSDDDSAERSLPPNRRSGH